MDTVKKKLIIPAIFFGGMMIVNFNSLVKGIEKHETWRIVVASAAYAVIIPFAIVVGIHLLRMKRAQGQSEK